MKAPTAEELSQAWAMAYALAFAATTLGVEIRGADVSPDEIDDRARSLAERAMETVRQKLHGDGKKQRDN